MATAVTITISSTLRFPYNIEAPRTCSNCGSTKTSNLQWYRDGSGGHHCNRCQMKLVYNLKWHPITNPKRIVFQGKQVFVDEPLRKGVCSLCGARVGHFNPKTGHYCKRTAMHNQQYDPNHPTAHTIEVCVPCHKQEHQRHKRAIADSVGGSEK